MLLHPDLAAMLAKAAGLPPMHTVPIDVIRATDLQRYEIGVPKDDVASVEDRTIEGPRGPIPIRIYRPPLSDRNSVTVFFHGSGFVICSIETHDAMCRQICRHGHSVVVSVDYRLAPENKFPAGPDDCYAATVWAAAHAASIGGILSVLPFVETVPAETWLPSFVCAPGMREGQKLRRKSFSIP